MSLIEQAVSFDIAAAEASHAESMVASRPSAEEMTAAAANLTQAARAYEKAIGGPGAPLAAYLNLAFLYWQATECGFYGAVPVSREFFDRAYPRCMELVQFMEKEFPQQPEIRFWRLYFGFAALGDPPFVEECKHLVKLPGCTLVPYFYLFSSPGGEVYLDQALRLLTLCEATPTLKNRYIKSVIDGALLRMKGSEEE